jgi:hypothetical protein
MMRSWSETAPWQSREVTITLPASVASAMWERARKWDVEAGGRFDVHSAAILLWSGPIQPGAPWPVLLGSLFVHWRTPTDDQATVYAIAWDPESGGSEDEMLRAVNLLAGQLVTA